MNKLIAIDLDGTLLRNDKTVSEHTLQTLIECEEKDNIIIYATARPPRDIVRYIPSILMNKPIICYNGACITKMGKIIYGKEILRENVIKILDIAKKLNQQQICIEINDELYSNFDVSEYFGNVPYKQVDLYNLNFKSSYKIIICSKNKISNEILDSLPKECKGVITDKGTLCQIMSSEVSKWNAIKHLLEVNNISEANVISFGNDYNDIDMIKNSGVGVAMENAIDELKLVSKHITCSNNDDGVAKFLGNNKHLYC